MAIKKVKLPNNTVVDINDSRISGVDSTPTSGSINVVTSGGVAEAISINTPGTLDTTATTAQTTSASESLSGTVNLHKVAKTGTYSDLIDKPTAFAEMIFAGGTRNVANDTYPKRILFSSANDSKWVPANNNSAADYTSIKTVTQTPINPFGEIVYYDGTTNLYVSSYAAPAESKIYSQIKCYIGYSFCPTANYQLSVLKPVYVKCAPQSDGSAIIDSTNPIVQSLPSSEDGKIYIYLGLSSGLYSLGLSYEHPIYYYSDGAIRQWTNSAVTESTVSGWGFTKNTGTLTGVSFNGSAATVSNGIAAINATIPAAPGTLDTTATTAQTTSSSEALSGSVMLHKIAKTGTYSDLIGTPTIPDNVWKWGEGQARCVVVNSSRAGTTAGYDSFSEGYLCDTGGSATSNTKTANASNVLGSCSHAEGNATIARGLSCHSEGKLTYAGGEGSHAEGIKTNSGGKASHTEGEETKTNNVGEHAGGRYNSSTRTSSTYGDAGNTSFSHGIGTADNARKNALEIMENGDAYLYGVGSYDGTNYSAASTLQSVISNSSPNNSTITIQMNGSTVDSFTTNAASAKTIDLGTVITSHQDISGKANVATTLSGYGITDATISGQTVTLGSNSVTVPQILSGTADPTSAQGNDGDIYIKLSS